MVITRVVLISVFLFGWVGFDAFAEPFESVESLEAIRRTIAEHDRVLVSFSVPWCMGCVQMDQTVWRDPRVLESLGSLDNAVRPDGSILDACREEFGLGGYPVLILFRHGEEAGRLSGVWDSTRVLEWIEEPGKLIEPGDPQSLPIGDVHDRAVDLVLEQRWEDAARFLCVFWVRSRHDRGMTDMLRWLRSTRYESMLRRVAQDPRARRKIEVIRESLPEKGPEVGSDPRLIDDWLVLSRALGYEDQVDKWIDRMLGDADGVVVLSAHERVFDRLIELDRFEDAGNIASEQMWSRWVARSRGDKTGDPVHDAAPARVVMNETRDAPDRVRVFIKALRDAGRGEEASALEHALGA